MVEITPKEIEILMTGLQKLDTSPGTNEEGHSALCGLMAKLSKNLKVFPPLR